MFTFDLAASRATALGAIPPAESKSPPCGGMHQSCHKEKLPQIGAIAELPALRRKCRWAKSHMTAYKPGDFCSYFCSIATRRFGKHRDDEAVGYR
jgi:hypothetical protein